MTDNIPHFVDINSSTSLVHNTLTLVTPTGEKERGTKSFQIVFICTNSAGVVLFLLVVTFCMFGSTPPFSSSHTRGRLVTMGFDEIRIRNYDRQSDRFRVEDLERRCEVGATDSLFLFTDTIGDPVCRIRNSPSYKMLVAEFGDQLVGVIRGSIKIVTLQSSTKNQASVGYILGLRVSPFHRRKGIGSHLVQKLEEWFCSNNAEFTYMATERDNKASTNLFIDKLGFMKFRTPAILVNPVHNYALRISPKVDIIKIKVEQAERLYRKYMVSTEFFPYDIDRILTNKLSLGTWVAYPRGESWNEIESDGLPTSWAMLSVWNSGELFKLRVGRAPVSCLLYAKSSQFIDRIFPCLKAPTLPDLFQQFGFYFMYGLCCEGLNSGVLMHSLCRFVHNMGASQCEDCMVIVTEVGEYDILKRHIPHSRLLSCTEDLWCIKALKNDEQDTLIELTNKSPSKTLFVDPREV